MTTIGTAGSLDQEALAPERGVIAFEGQAFAMLAEEPFGSPMFDFLGAFSGTIAGGTNEIRRNIAAERGLDMPRV